MKTITKTTATSKKLLKSFAEMGVSGTDGNLDSVTLAVEAAYLLGRTDESADSIKRMAAFKHKVELKAARVYSAAQGSL